MLIDFDLEKALAGAKIVTRTKEPVIAIVDMRPHGATGYDSLVFVTAVGAVYSCSLDGRFTAGREHQWDLFLVTPEPERKTWYMGIPGTNYAEDGAEYLDVNAPRTPRPLSSFPQVALTTERQPDGKWKFVSAEDVARG